MGMEWLIGAGAGVFVFLIYLGLDITPFLFLGGAVAALYLLTQGRGVGRTFEFLGGGEGR